MVEVRHFLTNTGRSVFAEWFNALNDKKAQSIITARITRMTAGNFGDSKQVQGAVRELRIDYGPGYRIYYAVTGSTVVLLLCGGDKRRQSADIQRAVDYWTDFKERKKCQ